MGAVAEVAFLPSWHYKAGHGGDLGTFFFFCFSSCRRDVYLPRTECCWRWLVGVGEICRSSNLHLALLGMTPSPSSPLNLTYPKPLKPLLRHRSLSIEATDVATDAEECSGGKDIEIEKQGKWVMAFSSRQCSASAILCYRTCLLPTTSTCRTPASLFRPAGHF